MSVLSDPEAIGRFLVTAFFAAVFLQSAADKLLDPEGNVAYFKDHFKNSPVPADSIALVFWMITFLEATAGLLCAIGILLGDFARKGMGACAWGIAAAGFALLCLMAGQRLARDYAGAAVLAAYFAVALIGLGLF
jgi:putative oxidoreductase